MINIPCGQCGSMNIGKNGTAAAGARNITAEPAEKLLCGRVSQRGIARAVRVSRNRLISHIKKKKSDRSDRKL